MLSELQRTELPADPMLPRPYRIQRVRRELPGTFTWELAPANGDLPSSFEPGQFNMVYVGGIGEIPVSISGDPANPEKMIHTIRAVGQLTRAMETFGRHTVVGLRGPFGTPWPVDEIRGRDVVLVSGGLGLAPLRPAFYHLLQEREAYNRIILLYGARDPDEILYRDEIKQWRRHLDLDVEVTVDSALGRWRGHVGVVPELIKRVDFDPERTTGLICGPEVMMKYSAIALINRGVAAENLYVSMERNMKCAVGFCGHCQLGPHFVCKDGPVFRYDHIKSAFSVREL